VAALKRTGTTPATTKAGNTLDPDHERRLTAEAEAGFDPATLARRPVGRPSLSGRAGHSNRVDLPQMVQEPDGLVTAHTAAVPPGPVSSGKRDG
jgi:hypothetical protein